MNDLKSMTFEEVQDLVLSIDEPKFRAKQIFGWINKGISDFSQMKNIPNSLKEKLTNYSYISVANIEKKQISSYDNTVKYLYRLYDDNFIESVVMSYHHGNTICISTQVGCKKIGRAHV